MFNPVKVDRFFYYERKKKKNMFKLIYMSIFSINEHFRYNEIVWQNVSNMKAEKYIHYKSQFWWIINPFSLFRHAWDVLWIIFYSMTIFVLPIRLASILYYDHVPHGTLLPADIFFNLSVIIEFTTGVYSVSNEVIDYRPSVIVKKYLMGYFVVDVLSSIPRDIFIYYKIIPSSEFIIFISYFLCYLKLLRYPTFLSYIRKLFYHINVKGLMVDIFIILLIWLTVSYYLLTTLHFLNLYRSITQDLLNGDRLSVLKFMKEIVKVNFITTTEIYTIPDTEYHLVFFQQIVIFIANFIEIFCGAVMIVMYWSTRDNDITSEIYRDEVNTYTAYLKAPDNIGRKIKNYYSIYYNHTFVEDNKQLLNFFTPHEQVKIMWHIDDNIMMRVGLFRDLQPRLKLHMCKMLKKEVLFTGYKLTIIGEVGAKMYIVSSGNLYLFSAALSKIDEIQDGGCLGEFQLLGDTPYPFMTICSEITTVYSLDRADFESVLKNIPEVYDEIAEKILDRHIDHLLRLGIRSRKEMDL